MSSRGVSEKTEKLIIFLIGKIYSFTLLLCENGRFQSENSDLMVSENLWRKNYTRIVQFICLFSDVSKSRAADSNSFV